MQASSQTAPARRQRRPWTEEDQRKAEEMRAQRMSYKAIGLALNRSTTTVRMHLNQEAAAIKKAYNQRYYQQNRSDLIDYRRSYYERNKEDCDAAVQRYKAANPDKLKERNKKFYWGNKAKRLAENAAYRKEHKERIKRQRLRYYRQNRQRLLERQKDRYNKLRAMGCRYYEVNPEKARANGRRFYQANRDKIREYGRAYSRTNRDKCYEKNRRYRTRRRTARRVSLLTFCYEQKEKQFSLFGDCCAYCGNADYLTVDHVLALSAGGLDELANIAPACRRCNSSKQSAPVEDWYRRQPFFTEERWRKIQRHCPAAVAGQLPLALAS